MSFLNIKDPGRRMTLVDEYVKAKKTVPQRNMVNRERKLAIGGAANSLPFNRKEGGGAGTYEEGIRG